MKSRILPSTRICCLLLLVTQACVNRRRPLPEFSWAGQFAASKVGVQVFDPAGNAETDVVPVGRSPRLVGKLRANPWKKTAGARKLQNASQEKKGSGVQGEQEPRVGNEELYDRFGSKIIIHADGRVTKPYYLDNDSGTVLTKLLDLSKGVKSKTDPNTYQFGKKAAKKDAAIDDVPSILDTLIGDYEIIVQKIDDFDTQEILAMKPMSYIASMASIMTIKNDLVLVTSSPDGLEAFEQAMDLFYGSVPQILIEARVVEVSYNDTLDFGVSPINSTTPTLRTLGKGSFVKTLISKFPNSSGGQSGSASLLSAGLLTIGGIHDNLEINAILELLQTRAKADIVSRPRIAVRNGGIAIITTTTKIPFPKATIIGTQTKTSIGFETVGVKMLIHPSTTIGDTIRLQVHAEVAAVTGFANTDPIPTPEISTRMASTTVYVPNGKSVVIGGLLTKTRFENESSIPLLGDIPLLGFLFRSTLIQTSHTELIFFITPRIITDFEEFESEGDLGDDGD